MHPVQIIEPTVVKKLFDDIEIDCDGTEIDCIVVEVDGDEYDACVKASIGGEYWGNSKPGAYGAGLGSTDDDEFKTARTGLLGQMAFAKIFNQPVDLEYRKGGDKFDNKIGEYTYDIKCAMRNSGRNLIQHTNEFGKKNQQALSKDCYILSYIESEDIPRKKCKVVIVGFATKKDIKGCKTKIGDKGNGHLNYAVPFNKSRSILKLLTFVRSNCNGTKL
jgi:hypothetical protein